jgi:diguanylate cyclase (GGDEF)-like protein
MITLTHLTKIKHMGSSQTPSEQTSGNDILIDQTRLLEQLIFHWRQAVNEDFPVSMFIVDVDRFSQMESKASCFEQILNAIRQQFNRETDFIARFNRKQIMAISSHMSYRQSTQMATKLHKAVSMLEIFHPHSPTGRYATVSIGHSTYAPVENDCYGILDMLATVQHHVDQAKQAGGNCSKTRLHSRVLK